MAVAITILLPSLADAAVESALDYLSTDPTEVSLLQDEDFELLIIDTGPGLDGVLGTTDDAANGLVDDGDVLMGVWRAEAIWADSSDPNTGKTPAGGVGGDANFTAFFAVQVGSVLQDGTAFKYTFGAPTVANWSFLESEYEAPARADSDTVLLIYDDSNPGNVYPYWLAVGDATTQAGITSTVKSATDGTLVWQFGFNQEGDEFWYATSNTKVIGPTLKVSYEAGLNLTGGISNLIGHDVLNFSLDPIGLAVDYEIELQGSSEGLFTNGWLKTDTDLYVNAVPEPASLLIWAAFAGVGAAYAARRRDA
jgi:hypothetical protein